MNIPDQHHAQDATPPVEGVTVPRTSHTTQSNKRLEWNQQFPWEGRRLLEQLTKVPAPSRGVRVTAYVSESPELRAMLQGAINRHFEALGVPSTTRVRSAYKTGFFWVTEELLPLWRRAHADRLTIHYPQLPSESGGRFLQELYPLAAILEREGLQGQFLPASPTSSALLAYHAVLWRGDTLIWQGECPIPLHPRTSPDGREVLTPTGRLTVHAAAELLLDERIPTDGELFWDWYSSTVLPKVLDWADQRSDGLVFKNLSVTLHLSEPDLPLSVLEERASMTEALTEEVYFGTLDALKRHTGTPSDARSLTPGRIVPAARATPGQDGRARVVLTDWNEPPTEHADLAEVAAHIPSVATRPLLSDRPWHPASIWAYARELAEHHQLEWHVPAHSVDGRPVPAVIQQGKRTPGVIVTGGQHANETTGPVAALRLIEFLANRDVSFAVLPLENPDGAHLHRALIQIAPEHMHHAARYTSLGDDLEARLREGRPRWEARARAWAAQVVGATLHLNLHGYPAHEWVRPYSGYAPHGFESWALPAGFVTIIWHWPGHHAPARAMAEAIAARLKNETHVAEHAARAFQASSAHLLQPHYQLIHGLPFILAEQPAALCPLTVITEAPDETIYGKSFQMFVQAHLTVCEAAVTHHLQHHSR